MLLIRPRRQQNEKNINITINKSTFYYFFANLVLPLISSTQFLQTNRCVLIKMFHVLDEVLAIQGPSCSHSFFWWYSGLTTKRVYISSARPRCLKVSSCLIMHKYKRYLYDPASKVPRSTRHNWQKQGGEQNHGNEEVKFLLNLDLLLKSNKWLFVE